MAQDKSLLSIISTNGFALQTSAIKNAIRVSKSATFSEQVIINRSSPVLTYSSSGVMTVDISLELKAVSGDLTPADMNNIAKGLTSLTFPVNSGVNPPPLCRITVGQNSMLQNWQCVCANASTNIGEDNLWDANGDSVCLTVSLQFKGIETQSVDASDFAGNSLQAYKNLTFN